VWATNWKVAEKTSALHAASRSVAAADICKKRNRSDTQTHDKNNTTQN